MITLPLPNRTEEKTWDQLVKYFQDKEAANLKARSLLHTDSPHPPRHRLFNNMRSLVFVGGNGAGKSKMIHHLSKSLPQALTHELSVVKVSARRDHEALKSAFAAALASVQGLDRQSVIPGLKKAIRKIIKGYTTRDEEITRRLASLNEVFQLVFPGMRVEVVRALDHFLSEDCYKLAIAIKKTNHDRHYSIHDLSDGEKEVFFLVWRVLSMPKKGFLLIDEPEAHLHRAAVDVLWNRLEREKPLVFFVYFTHDLAFAASRIHSEIVSLHSYTSVERRSPQWDWSLVPQERSLPPEVLLKIVGSRGSQVLFVEGDTFNSLDYRLYHAIYGHEWMIVPRGGGSNVRNAVEAMNGGAGANPLLGYQVRACGIVDRDTHSDDYLARLAHLGILAPEVNEVENFFCMEEVFIAVALHGGKSAEEAATSWAKVQQNIVKLFEDELEFEIDLHTRGLVAEAKEDKRTAHEPTIRSEVEVRLNALAREGDAKAILRAYNASNNNEGDKNQKKSWIGDTAAKELEVEQEAYIDTALQVIREQKEPAWSTMKIAIGQYLPRLPGKVVALVGYGGHTKSWAVELYSTEHQNACLHVFDEQPEITLEQLTVEAQQLIIECCGLPKSIAHWTTCELFDFYARHEANAGDPSPNEKGKEKQPERPSANSSLLEETKEAFLTALVKVGRSQALADQREKLRSSILESMWATKRALAAAEKQELAAVERQEEQPQQSAESGPPEQGESRPVGEPAEAVAEANSFDDAEDPFAELADLHVDDQESSESCQDDRNKELERENHALKLRNAKLIEELKQARARATGPRRKKLAAASEATQTPGAAKPDHRLYNENNCGEAVYFLSVDLREANFQALRALGYVDQKVKSWCELVDAVLKPVSSVAALFYAKAFRMHCLKGFESSQVKDKLREMMREIRQVIGDGLGEPVEDDNCDEVVYKIEGAEQARASKEAVEQALKRLEDRISFRVELFRLSPGQKDGCGFFAKTNVDTNAVQLKMLIPLAPAGAETAACPPAEETNVGDGGTAPEASTSRRETPARRGR